MKNTEPNTFDRLLDIREVLRSNSLSRATVYRGISAGTFPAPIRLTPAGRRVGWRESDLVAWSRNPSAWPVGGSK